jgi:fatty-acyl-CoA synthase
MLCFQDIARNVNPPRSLVGSQRFSVQRGPSNTSGRFRRVRRVRRYFAASSNLNEFPKEYHGLYQTKGWNWPYSLPLEVQNSDGNKLALSHVRGPVTKPLLEQTMFESLEATVSKHGDRYALSVPFQQVQWTYKEFLQKVDSLALGLLALGVVAGDRVGAWIPNTSEWITLQYATARIGAILVCVNPAYRSNELVHAVNLTGLKGIVFQGSLKSSNYVELLKAAAPDIEKHQPNKLRLSEMPSLRFLIHLEASQEAIPKQFPSQLYEDILIKPTAESYSVFARLPKILPTDATNLQFTSGTTGLPKGSTLTHRNIVNNGYFVGERLGMTESDILVTPVPMYHCFGCVMSNIASVTHGAHLVYPAPQFNAEATLQAVHDFKATLLHGVPTMFITERSLPNFERFNLTSLRSGIMAGSSCPEVTMNMVRDDMYLKDITICYGMTETSPVSTQTSADDPIWARVETVGKVQDHLQVKLIDPETKETVRLGESGEICTKGYSVMQGYWGNPAASASSIQDEWMHTGDIGTMDEFGYIRVVGRNKDMISRGGEKVYPREVEEFLYTHPSIQDVQIIGVPDQRLGEEIFAWIKLKRGAKPLSVGDIASFCQNKIAHYKVPRHVQCLEPGEDFPMTVSGKIQKFILRDRATKSLVSGEAL